MKRTVTKTVCIVAALAAVAGSALASGKDEADARVLRGNGAVSHPVRTPDLRGSGQPGTAVFHGVDGMVIRFTVPGAAVTPARGVPPEVNSSAPLPSPPAAVGGGFTPEQ